MNALEQAIEIISKSDNPLIILPKQTNFDQLGSAASLFYTLNKSGKFVNYFPKKLPQNYPLKFEKTFFPKNLVITIKDKEVSELRYEKEKQLLKIFLTVKDGKINKNNIKIDALPNYKQETDLIIAIGLQNLEQIGEFYEKNFKLFYENPILNIDNKKTNSRFGNINLVIEEKPISLILKNLFRQANYKLDNNVKLWLLSGAISCSKQLPVSSEIFGLMSIELDYQKFLDVFLNEQSKQKQLLKEALKTMNFLKNQNFPIISLSSEKFEKTNTKIQDIKYLLKKLSAEPFYFPQFLLLWQSPKNFKIQAVFYSQDQKIGNKLKEEFQTQEKGNGLLLNLNISNLLQAKEQILETIS
jgi:nanoRNase/pAp phosphatase (c-di-AMP/oligoRNAs hydrolase)